jgi:hypothetical protein
MKIDGPTSYAGIGFWSNPPAVYPPLEGLLAFVGRARVATGTISTGYSMLYTNRSIFLIQTGFFA